MEEYPLDDQFEDVSISKVEGDKDSGWSIENSDGWMFFVPATSPVEPKPGMAVRLYSRGIGSRVRGIFIDGKKVFYRTEQEDKEHHEILMYGADAEDWLKRWDEGKSVWSIEMGGLGPGYEQAIQITVAEILRILLEKKYDAQAWSEEQEIWKLDRDEIEKLGLENTTITNLGLSGAQWGAALSLAACLYRSGPREIMADKAVKDRHIQVSKNFPH